MNNDLTYNFISSILIYHPSSGEIRWLKDGRLAGTVRNDGYAVIGIRKKRYYSHRIAWLLMKKKWPCFEIDHIDLDPSNIKLDNLRAATHQQNSFNKTKTSNNRSGFKGVSFHKKTAKWRATIMKNKKQQSLGLFDSPIAASRAYSKASSRLFGEFKRTA